MSEDKQASDIRFIYCQLEKIRLIRDDLRKRNTLLREQYELLLDESNEVEMELKKVKKELYAIKHSTSWRLTAPIRKLLHWLKPDRKRHTDTDN